MGDKSRLCNVCGTWVDENEDLVQMADGMGPAHIHCAMRTSPGPIGRIDPIMQAAITVAGWQKYHNVNWEEISEDGELAQKIEALLHMGADELLEALEAAGIELPGATREGGMDDASESGGPGSG